MKAIIFTIIGILCSCLSIFGQNKNDEKRVSVNVVIPDTKDIPQEATDFLVSKMNQLVTANGMADYGYNERFVLTAKINTLSKDITNTAPVRILQKLEIVFMVGDVVDNKLFKTTSLIVSGIGTNETKTFISAFQRINVNNKQLTDLLSDAKRKIVDYYTDNCDAIITRANTFASMQEYDKAIYTLITVPNVCSDCYQRCQKAIIPIYQKKVNEEGVTLLNQAKALWAKNPTSDGLSEVITLTANISPQSTCYTQVVSFYETIEKKLSNDEKRAWNFQMKQYEDKQKLKQSIVDACKAIGVAFGQGQPQNVTRNIISKW